MMPPPGVAVVVVVVTVVTMVTVFFFFFEHRERAGDRRDIAAVIDGLRRPVDHRAGRAALEDGERRTLGPYLGIVIVVIVVTGPQSSVAAQARVITPASPPQLGSNESAELTLIPPQLSLPVALPTRVDSPHSTVPAPGQLIDGAVVSTMVIV